MDCGRYVDLMTEYMEGDLSAPDQKLWEKHFDDCGRCKDFFHSFESSLELVTYVKAQGCPLHVKQRLDKFLHEKLNLPR